MTTRTPWTAQQLQQLRDLYPNNVTALVAQAIGKPLTSIYSKAIRRNADLAMRIDQAKQILDGDDA